MVSCVLKSYLCLHGLVSPNLDAPVLPRSKLVSQSQMTVQFLLHRGICEELPWKWHRTHSVALILFACFSPFLCLYFQVCVHLFRVCVESLELLGASETFLSGAFVGGGTKKLPLWAFKMTTHKYTRNHIHTSPHTHTQNIHTNCYKLEWNSKVRFFCECHDTLPEKMIKWRERGARW